MGAANRDSAPGRTLVAVGLGLAAIAAVRPLSFDSRFVTYWVIPGLTFALLWMSTSKLPPAPSGTRNGRYGLVAVLALLSSTLVPLSLIVGPVRVIAVSLLALGVLQRDPRLAFPALILAFLPVDVEFAQRASMERTWALAAASAAFLLAGTWGMRFGASAGPEARGASQGGLPELVPGAPGGSGGSGTQGR